MRRSASYVAMFPDDMQARPERLREAADALDRVIENERPSPAGWAHVELFAPYWIRRYADLLEVKP